MFSILEGHAGFSRDPASGNWKEVKTTDYLLRRSFLTSIQKVSQLQCPTNLT
ncbi:hypothetical protein [Klebsiella phage Kpn02]|uniref:Uncharacterized protein n=1 Tax=Klebsiella phage Kpn02 TaxID=3044023 RepID=A0AAT9V681_9CAUD|nr:hypothetical protein [Klebsiella phage Kpn02]